MAVVEVECHACQRKHSFESVVPFRAECDACNADLHVCLACRMHDRYAENECREDQADPVANKDRRNLCEYFKPLQRSDDADDAAALAKKKLAALFGGAPATSPLAPSVPTTSDAQAEARRKLDELFKKM